MRCGTGPRALRHRLLAALAALPLLLPATAAAAIDPERLRALLDAGRADEVWALAREHRAGQEGEPRFDFYYGLAAIATGNLGEAVFALRRVLAVSPGLVRARAELGHAYFLLGEDLRARQELERVLAHDPPMPLRAHVERRLHALDRRAARYGTKVSGYFELGAGHDTNVNSATDVETVDTVDFGTVQLDENARAQPDEFARVAGGVRVSRPVIADLNVFAELEGERRYHADETDFEVGAAQARAGVVVRSERTRSTLAARAGRVYLGGERYRNVDGLDAAFRYAMSEVQVAQVATGYSRLRHETREERDSDLWRIGAGVTRTWRVRLRPTLAVTAFFGEEHAELDTQAARARAERELYGAGTDLRLQLAPRWVLRSGAHIRRSEYAATHEGLFDEPRVDDYYDAELILEWRPALNWRVQQRLSHAVNDSNLDLFAYDRSVAELRIRYEFE